MRRILACLLVLSMMLAFSACQNTKPAGTPDEPSVPAEPVEPVQPDEPAQPDTPEQPSEPDAPETPEEPSVRCLPLSYQTNRYYGMFDEGMKSYVDYPRIRVDGGDWPALADALDRLSAELYDEAMDLAEDLDELPLGDTLYSGQIAQTVTRADENCLSLLFEEQRNDGTDEPDWEYEAYNFDPATGAELTLEDVFDDAGMLPDMLETRLRERYPQTEFKDLWPVVSSGTVWEEQGQTEPDPEFEWTLSYEGVEFYFEPGLIADYAAGPFHVTVRYVDEPIAVAAKFQRIPAAYAELLEHPAERTLDLDSDGQLDTLLTEIPAQFGESGWAVPTLEVTINGEKTRIDCPENTIRVQLYLVRANGAYSLYALCGLSSGADTLLIIALDAKTATLAAALENTGLAVQAQDGANWIELLTDPTAFRLQTRDATGVEHVPQPYHIGEDGLPALGTN